MKAPFRFFSALAVMVGLAHVALAQSPTPPSPPPVPSEPQVGPAVSDAELDTFTSIYVDLQELNSRFETEMSSVESEAEAQQIQARLQQESTNIIEEHGWSVEQYNLVAQTINSDPELLDQALELIAEKS